jgi:hypothetical protein
MRDFTKLKELSDYHKLDSPVLVPELPGTPLPKVPKLYILRMLVRPKYGEWFIPKELKFLKRIMYALSDYDKDLGIEDSWCYVTVRHGPIESETDDSFHFDGSSFRTDLIPERNYVYTNHSPTEYKVGQLSFPPDFDPLKHNLFTFAERQLANEVTRAVESNEWYLLSPFVLHRRPPKSFLDRLVPVVSRTFYRICFTDIEARDINNTPNPMLPTDAYGRDPVRTFRDRLASYFNL